MFEFFFRAISWTQPLTTYILLPGRRSADWEIRDCKDGRTKCHRQNI